MALHPRLAPLAQFAWSALEPVGIRPKTRLREPFVPPLAIRMAAMLNAGEHDNLRFALSRVHRDSQRSVIEAMLDEVSRNRKAEDWLEALWTWYRTHREVQARTTLLYGLLKHAWMMRGEGALAALKERQRAAFIDSMEEAERLLEPAIAAEPDHADLLCLGLQTARGLGLPLAEHWQRFRALSDVDPLHFRGHLAILENLRVASDGSDESVLRFARARTVQVPVGHPLRALIGYAHFALRPAVAIDQPGEGDLYFGQPDVAEEMRVAWQETLASPLYRDELNAEAIANLLAAGLFLSGHLPETRAALALMEGHCLPYPWVKLAMTPKERANPGWVVDRVAASLNTA